MSGFFYNNGSGYNAGGGDYPTGAGFPIGAGNNVWQQGVGMGDRPGNLRTDACDLGRREVTDFV